MKFDMDFNVNGPDPVRGRTLHRLNARQLRSFEPENLDTPSILSVRKRFPLYFILDNVYDTYNIGGLFRLADALNISKLYICGDSETPPNHKIKKASIGTYKIVPWEYKKTTKEAIVALRDGLNNIGPKSGPLLVVAVEQAKGSVPYYSFSYSFPLALVVGNETRGCSNKTLAACDAVVEIPMFGTNISLNVIVSTAVVGYHARKAGP